MNLISDQRGGASHNREQAHISAKGMQLRVRAACDWLGLGLTSGGGRGQQSVVDTQQEEQQHLPGLPHHGNGLTGQFLDGRQDLLTQPDVVQAVLFWSGRTHRRTQITGVIESSQRDVLYVSIALVEVERT